MAQQGWRLLHQLQQRSSSNRSRVSLPNPSTPAADQAHQVAIRARLTAAVRTSGSSAHCRHQLRGAAGCQLPRSSPLAAAAAWLGGARPSSIGWLSSASAARGETLATVISPRIPLPRRAGAAAWPGGRTARQGYRARSPLLLAALLPPPTATMRLLWLYQARVRRRRRVQLKCGPRGSVPRLPGVAECGCSERAACSRSSGGQRMCWGGGSPCRRLLLNRQRLGVDVSFRVRAALLPEVFVEPHAAGAAASALCAPFRAPSQCRQGWQRPATLNQGDPPSSTALRWAY